MLWSSAGVDKLKCIIKKGDHTVNQEVIFNDRYSITVSQILGNKSQLKD